MADSASAASDGDIPEGERAALELLDRGTLEVEGRLVDASNATLFCTISGAGAQATCVYKPIAGERPLWDFPNGTLAGREVAAYLVSRAAGWNIVPPTVMRDGPFGPGMCQLWIDVDDEVDLVALSRREDHPGLREMAVFDAVVNNADRKIGHLLPVTDGHLYGCDHGVTFSEDYKLRTVLWQWRGKVLPRQSVEVLRRLSNGLRGSGSGGSGSRGSGSGGSGSGGSAQGGGWLAEELGKHLTASEVRATRARVDRLLKHRVHPFPPDDWPAIPWPPVL
ncbi:MAG TPA: SCO1664 family protein [Trebonia sp.]|nr:SCO1664 family protein [Trebonia sp.]